ncbi:MAG: hypothetical protein CMJ36_06140 [Phycisphaerae bacterium]|nr:hypothetical protein [Phycisphaerae bacterium]
MLEPVLLMALLAPGILAQDGPTAEEVVAQAKAPLGFNITTGAWLIRLRGDSALGRSGNLSLDDQLAMNDREAVFRGEFRVGRDDWGVEIMGMDFETSSSGTFGSAGTWGDASFAAGDAFRSSFDFMSIGVEGQWNPLDLIGEANTHIPMFLTVGPHLGINYSDIRQRLSFDTTASDEQGEFTSIYGGGQLILRMDTMDRLPWLRKIEFRAGGGFGAALGHDGGTMFHARADMRFYFMKNIAVLFGYRLLELNVEKGDWKPAPSLQGLFVGASIEF